MTGGTWHVDLILFTQFQSMNKTAGVIITLTFLAPITGPAQNPSANSQGIRQLQLSVQNGLSSFLVNQSIDSVYFLKSGFNAGVQGSYFWNSFGLSGRAGYFANGTDKQALEDFARKRRTPRDRMQLSSGSFKGMYLFTGPAFQSTLNKWRVQSSLEGGLVNKPSSQVSITDNVSPDIVYYRNVFGESNSFAWSAGLSVSYAVSRQFLVGVNADYLNTRHDVVNYDMQRANGREAKNITTQAGFLNTGVRLSYLFNKNTTRDASSGLATGKRQHKPMTRSDEKSDTCKCEDKMMDVKALVPYIVEIRFASVEEAKEFLDTYEPLFKTREAGSGIATGRRQHMSNAQSNPLYQPTSQSGSNPLHQGKSASGTISNAAGTRGVVQRNAKGEQEFYLLPTYVDLAEVLAFEDGRVTIHVETNAPSTREAGSGLATGRRQHQPLSANTDGSGDVSGKDSTGTGNMMKAGVSTSRSNIPRCSKMMANPDGTTLIECEIELNGRTYTARITAKHDTAKNSIGNIR